MSVKVNGKKVEGAAGCLIATGVMLFIGFMFGAIGLILSSPLWIPILLGILIGKAL